jgi:hypothetical protein
MDAGYWLLDTGNWIMDAGHWSVVISHTGHLLLDSARPDDLGRTGILDNGGCHRQFFPND